MKFLQPRKSKFSNILFFQNCFLGYKVWKRPIHQFLLTSVTFPVFSSLVFSSWVFSGFNSRMWTFQNRKFRTKTTLFRPNCRVLDKMIDFEKSTRRKKIQMAFFSRLIMIFSLNLIFLLTYLVFVSPHRPFTKVFDNKFDFSITISTDSLFLWIPFPIVRNSEFHKIPKSKNHKIVLSRDFKQK